MTDTRDYTHLIEQQLNKFAQYIREIYPISNGAAPHVRPKTFRIYGRGHEYLEYPGGERGVNLYAIINPKAKEIRYVPVAHTASVMVIIWDMCSDNPRAILNILNKLRMMNAWAYARLEGLERANKHRIEAQRKARTRLDEYGG